MYLHLLLSDRYNRLATFESPAFCQVKSKAGVSNIEYSKLGGVRPSDRGKEKKRNKIEKEEWREAPHDNPRRKYNTSGRGTFPPLWDSKEFVTLSGFLLPF